MEELYGVSRCLLDKYQKYIYEENYKNQLNNESIELNKKNDSSSVY